MGRGQTRRNRASSVSARSKTPWERHPRFGDKIYWNNSRVIFTGETGDHRSSSAYSPVDPEEHVSGRGIRVGKIQVLFYALVLYTNVFPLCGDVLLPEERLKKPPAVFFCTSASDAAFLVPLCTSNVGTVSIKHSAPFDRRSLVLAW